MNVGELITRLQELKLDPSTDVLVDAPDGGEAYGISFVDEDEYTPSHEKNPKSVQVALIRLCL